MSGGSGGGGIQSAPQDNSIQLEIMRQAAADRENQRQDSLKATAKSDFQTKLGAAVSGAKSTGTDYLGRRGLSNNDYGSVIDSIINNTKLKVPELDSNPGSYFTDDTFASGLDNYQTMKRNNFTGQVNQQFAPGFEKSLIGDAADDSILDSILGTQRGQAQQQLDFNRKRGILNDAGYNEATNDIGRQASAGRSTLTGIGDSILGKDRQALLDIRGDAGNAASGYMLGGATPNVGDYFSTAKTKAGSLTGDLDGAIRSALGATNLFDVPGAIAKGGTAQGPINLTTADTTPGLPTIAKKNVNRGIGSTNVF